MMRLVVLLAFLSVLVAGCGGDEGPEPLPPAATNEVWAGRIVNRLMRPLNRDIEVLGFLDDTQTKLYIQEGRKDTLETLDRHLGDMADCHEKLNVIGPPPPATSPRADRVLSLLRRTCNHYGEVAEKAIVAVKLLGSGREEEYIRGERTLREAHPDAAAGAKAYDQAVRLARRMPEFQLHGLSPPA